MKELIESPRLYLANYFNELKHQVDLSFVLEQIHNFSDLIYKSEIKSIWLETINLIDLFEYECQNRIGQAEANRTNTNLEAILFNNKSMIYLNNSLIYITDCFINSLDIQNSL